MSSTHRRLSESPSEQREPPARNLAREDAPAASSRELVAYVVPRQGQTAPTVEELRGFLKERLPESLIPQAWMLLESLPLTINGKVDLRALPAPLRPQAAQAFLPPQGATEELIAGTWASLLRVPRVGRHDNFFELGGHSLLATQVMSRLNSALGTELPLRILFESATVAGLAARVDSARAEASGDALPPLVPAPRDAPLPLSFAQQRLWFLDQLEPGLTAYNVAGAVRLLGPLDVQAMAKSLEALVQRHETLRTTFALVDGQPVQRVHPTVEVPVHVEALSGASEDAVRQRVEEEARRPFDLATGPLLRARLLDLGGMEHVLLVTMHHIISDGWSISVFVRELAAFYGAFTSGQPAALAPLAVQYGDFSVWQRQWMRGERLDAQLAYWKQQLTGAPPSLELPTDRPRPAAQRYRGARHVWKLGRALTDALQQLSRRQDVTLFMTLLAGFNVLLGRYARTEDVVIGSAIANRGHVETEGLIGFFVNTLALRTDLSGDPRFVELLGRVRQTTLGAYAHQDVPFEKLVEALQLPRDLSRPPLFQVMFALQNMPPPRLELDGLTLTPVDVETGSAQFDLTLSLTEDKDGLVAWFEYNTDLFDAATVQRLAGHYQTLLEGAARDPRQRLSRLPLLPPAEHQRQLLDWNRTDVPWRRDECFHEVFEAQVDRTPDALAAVCEGRSLTYQELDARANRLAHHLLAAGVSTDRIVALFLDRELEFLIAMLAVWKAGGAYVPIDPALPRHRLRSVVEQSQCVLLLTEERHLADARDIASGRPVARVTELLEQDAPWTRPDVHVPPEALAYVIFTSGSTGMPKGVMIEHVGMLNHLRAKQHTLGITARDVVAEIATPSFDVSVWQFVCALLVGARTAIFKDESAWEPVQLLAKMRDERVTVLETVPTHMRIMLEEMEANPGRYDLSAMRWFIVNGEPLLPELCARWFKLWPGVPMVNAYGATEVSDDSAHYPMRSAPSMHWASLPINGTLPNLQAYILDTFLQPVPIGVAGEMYIGGVGVGRGYLGDPLKTARSFVPDPFATEPGQRLYRTGDLVRFLEDGSIEVLGRIDHQVKVRGFRIEIGEVEAALAQHPDLRDSVVIARGDKGHAKRLVAYAVLKEAEAVTPAALAEYLSSRLADYMVPSAFVLMDALPLLTNGKVDRNALPAPGEGDLGSLTAYVAPRTPLEQRVADVWADLLGLPRVGAEDNFFALGGHSLVAIQSNAKLRALTGVELSVRDLFEGQTVARIAQRIEALQSVPADGAAPAVALPPLRRLEPRAHYPLATYQFPEWYMHELEPDSPFYNVCIGDLVLTGDLDLDAFTRAWQTLVDRHDIFRLHFGYVDGQPVQRVRPHVAVTRESLYLDRRDVPDADFHAEVQRLARRHSGMSLDFENGPMFHVKLAHFSGGRFLVLFLVHHIIWDETSTMNLARELSELYNAFRAARAPRLPELRLGYVDYAAWIHDAVASGGLEPQRRYWLQKFATLPPPLELPLDFPRPAFQTFNGAEVHRVIPKERSAAIDAFARRHHTTLNIVFLSALHAQLHRLSGQRDFVVGTPIANRDDERVAPLLGLFATALPMRCTVRPGMTFQHLLEDTRQTAAEAYDHHVYPSVLAIQELNPDTDLSRNRLFSVMYGLQNNKLRLADEVRFDGLQLEFLRGIEVAESETSKFDLTYIVDHVASGVIVRLNYNTDLFKAATAERMLEQYLSLVEQLVADPTRALADYRMLSTTSEQRLLHAFNDTALPFDADTGVHRLVEAQVERTPDAVALSCEGGHLTYRQLDREANRWAHHLLAHGVGPEDRVGVRLEPSPELVLALLAVLKAGAAYVPVSPEHPEERQAQVLDAAGARLLITAGPLAQSLQRPGLTVLSMDAERAGVASRPSTTPAGSPGGRALAYVLFTSGTTGVPKGIEIEHRGIANVVASTQRDYALDASDAVLLLTSFTFDPFVLDLYWPLTVGAHVVIPPHAAARSPQHLAEVVRREAITLFQCVPLMLGELVDARRAGRIPELPSLRRVLSGGAYLPRELRDAFLATFPTRLANHYGPTEVTVDASRFDCARPVEGDIVPLGRPIANTHLYLLDEALRPVPFGVTGELYVSTPGLARGYLGDPARTARAFLPDPFHQEPGTRMYRTGDLGRYTEAGDVEFIGRVDKQVKVRGNRVELEEIESRLAAHPAVAGCIVRHAKKPGGGDGLVATVELHEAASTLQGEGLRYRMFTLAQRPELKRAMDDLHVGAWPDFFAGDTVLREFWPRLAEEFAAHQFALVDEDDAVVAAGNALPIRWDGTREGLPAGWDAGLRQGFEDAARRVPADTLMILTGVVAEDALGRGLATLILRGFKALARAHGLGRVVVPVRPTGKASRPDLSFEQWCHARREDGQLQDPWLRIHERVGGRMLHVESRSQYIRADLASWEQWSGQRLTASGEYALPGTMQPVTVDVERGFAEYHDPSVWMEHPHAEGEPSAWRLLDGARLQDFLAKTLPDYMLPERYQFVSRLRRNLSGKVDERALPPAFGDEGPAAPPVAPQTPLQERLAELWKDVLGLPNVGIHADFFELGGHSMRALQLLARMTDQFGVTLGLRQLLKHRTIHRLEKLVGEALATRAPTPDTALALSHEASITAVPVVEAAPARSPEGRGDAVGHHGELLQGVFRDADGRLHRGLLSLPCGMLRSDARFQLTSGAGLTVEPAWKTKAARAAALTLEWAGVEPRGAHLVVHSNIPVGWGLGSSTSDVVATIRAVSAALGRPLTPEDTARLAVKAETASDSTIFGNSALIFGHREGVVLHRFSGEVLDLRVVSINLDPGGKGVDTLAHAPARYDSEEIEEFQRLRASLERALATGDYRLLGEVATASARINQRFLPKPHFELLLEVMEASGAVGLQVAHSGTVAGLLFDPRTSDVEARLSKCQALLAERGFPGTWRFSSHDRSRPASA